MAANSQSISGLVVVITETEITESRVSSKSTCQICKCFSGVAIQRPDHVQTGHVYMQLV